MTTALTGPPMIVTIADLFDRLGGVPADRVRLHPLSGTATEQDVIDIEARENRLCELVDGVLVEKSRGFKESCLAIAIGVALSNFVKFRKLGIVAGADGLLRLFPGMVRIPDVAYFSYDRLPGGKMPKEPIPSLVPDLAVEVLSASNTVNTVKEMDRKRREYFDAGVRLLLVVDPGTRTIRVYTGQDEFRTLSEIETLGGGGNILPGFSLDIKALFAEMNS